MKFNIYCTSYETDKLKSLSNFKIQKLDGQYSGCYEIDINTIEEFVDLYQAVDTDLIMHHTYCDSYEFGPHEFEIEIYDSRRE